MKKDIKLRNDLKYYDFIFIGCGLSTATVCALLPKSKKILIIEKRSHIGGNIFDYSQYDILVHKYGPHIFHTNDEEVFNFLNKYTQFNNFKNIVEANIDDKLIPLPININSLKILFPHEAENFIHYLKNKFPNKEKITILELSKIDKFQHLYQAIYNKVFVSYTVKMWDKKVEDLDVSVFSRVPIYLNNRNTYFTDKYEGMPIGGYTKMIENMISSDNIDLVLNTNIKDIIKIVNNKIYINDILIDKPIINCAPLDEIFDYKFGKLPYRSLDIQFEELDIDNYQKTAVVNYPQAKKMTRITEYKNFYANNINHSKTIISKEYPGSFDETSNRFFERYYPIPNDESRTLYSVYLAKCEKIKNFYQLGRLAKYEYINMDQAVRKAIDFTHKILNK